MSVDSHRGRCTPVTSDVFVITTIVSLDKSSAPDGTKILDAKMPAFDFDDFTQKSGLQKKSVADAGEIPTPVVTTTMLAKDKKVNNLLTQPYGALGQRSGIQDLLTLGDIRTAVLINPLKGEPPLLISDFLSSNINACYTIETEDVVLGAGATLSIQKQKKPAIDDYTAELWYSANSRIMVHLIQKDYSRDVLEDYAVYTSMVAEYLQLYIQKGVFYLDHEQRLKVSKEGRRFSDISALDERKFLVSPHSVDLNSSQNKKGKRNLKKKVCDSTGNPICLSYNGKGCDFDPCRFAHICLNQGCGAKHPQQSCTKVPSRFKTRQT